MKILLLEDDIILAELITEYLEDIYHIEHYFCGEKANEEIFTNKYDLLILDINVPNINGLKILKNLRENELKTPVILITASINFNDFEQAYDLGTNEFIRKPFKLEELKIRIHYLEKTFFSNNSEYIYIDKGLFLDKINNCLVKDNKVIKVPRKEAQIINYFLLHKNRVISINELIVNIWDYSETPSIATIRTYIKNLRKIFKSNYIETVKGIGYIFRN